MDENEWMKMNEWIILIMKNGKFFFFFCEGGMGEGEGKVDGC